MIAPIGKQILHLNKFKYESKCEGTVVIFLNKCWASLQFISTLKISENKKEKQNLGGHNNTKYCMYSTDKTLNSKLLLYTGDNEDSQKPKFGTSQDHTTDTTPNTAET
jgi:hypothetical protein